MLHVLRNAYLIPFGASMMSFVSGLTATRYPFTFLLASDHLTSYLLSYLSIYLSKIVVPFYRPRSNPDGWAVTVHCLEAGSVDHVEVRAFDGKNWESFIEGSGIRAFSKT